MNRKHITFEITDKDIQHWLPEVSFPSFIWKIVEKKNAFFMKK